MPSQAVALGALLWLMATSSAAEAQLPAPNGSHSGGAGDCMRRCGTVDIPYPFGVGPDHCFLSEDYKLNCTDTVNGTFVPFRWGNMVEVLNISLEPAQIRVMNYISSSCYDAASGAMDHHKWHWNLSSSVYEFSGDSMFVVIGCQTLAFIGDEGDVGKMYMTACAATCPFDTNKTLLNITDKTLLNITDTSCSGMGCCQATIPQRLQYYDVWFDDRWNTSEIYDVTPCSYGVLMDASNFTFSESYVTSSEFNSSNGGRAPLVLDWFIRGSQNCEACISSNKDCRYDAARHGYTCACTQGFQGNPYVTDGCRDINECNDPHKYCNGTCTNLPGTFKCSMSLPKGVWLGIGISAGVIVCLAGFLAMEVVLHRRSIRRQALQRQSDQYFQQHGGQLLSQMLKVEGNDSAVTFYEREHIMEATENFDKANIIGEGAQGTVYKATLDVDGTVTTVAVKRCKEIDESRRTEFLQELVILCRVSHPNIVKLLGCCLQLEAPILVYEFARHGTLQDLLHGRPRRCRLGLATRLRIAAESAKALAHLHSLPHVILHGDVKPANILLGDGCVVKVSDFGCSTINASTQVVPMGTIGYMDPEFLYDFQLTEMSDIYSFGVLLLELLSGRKPLAKDRKNLTVMLHECLGNGALDELVDPDIVDEGMSFGVIGQAADLARRCIAVPGETRPTMKQVAAELGRLSEQVPERAPPALELEGHGFTETTLSYGYTSAESETTGFYGVEGNAALSIEYAR